MSVFASKSALVTGASAGLGEEFALQLAERGAARIAISARRAERLAELKTTLVARHPALQVETIMADLSTGDGGDAAHFGDGEIRLRAGRPDQ